MRWRPALTKKTREFSILFPLTRPSPGRTVRVHEAVQQSLLAGIYQSRAGISRWPQSSGQAGWVLRGWPILPTWIGSTSGHTKSVKLKAAGRSSSTRLPVPQLRAACHNLVRFDRTGLLIRVSQVQRNQGRRAKLRLWMEFFSFASPRQKKSVLAHRVVPGFPPPQSGMPSAGLTTGCQQEVDHGKPRFAGRRAPHAEAGRCRFPGRTPRVGHQPQPVRSACICVFSGSAFHHSRRSVVAVGIGFFPPTAGNCCAKGSPLRGR